MNSLDSLDKMYDWFKERAREMFNDSGHHTPLFGIQVPDGQIAILGALWHSEAEQDIAIRDIRAACKEMKALRIVVITEGWMRKSTEATSRTEVLMISGQSGVSGENNLAGYYEINRDTSGKATVGKFVTINAAHATSVYDGLVRSPVLH